MEAYIPFGLKKDKLVGIDEVERGLKCDCICPNCKAPLVAAQGEKNVQHFKHDKGVEDKGCAETVMHLAAKRAFLKYNNTVLPPVWLFGRDEYERRQMIVGKREIEYSNVELERIFGSIIPDIKISAADQDYFVEVAVTHSWTHEKYEAVKMANISAVEIDLGYLYKRLKHEKAALTIDEFERIVIFDFRNRYWIFNKERNDFLTFMKSNFCSIKEIHKFQYKNKVDKDTEAIYDFMGVLYGEWYFVEDCPLNKAVWKGGKKAGQSYANIEKACDKCLYCAGKETNSITNEPEKLYCIWLPWIKFKNLIDGFTKNIKAIHGNQKVEIIKKDPQMRLF